MRVATWNMKQAVAPRRPLDDLWRWAGDEINADVMVLARVRGALWLPHTAWTWWRCLQCRSGARLFDWTSLGRASSLWRMLFIEVSGGPQS